MFEVLKKCFAINLNDYENINFDLEINKVILGTFCALMVGIVLLSIYRGTVRTVLMQLIRHRASAEENAKTLEELGLGKSRAVKQFLSGDNILTKMVSRVGEKKYSYKEYTELSKEEMRKTDKVDFSSARFYIKEEMKDRANVFVEKYVTSIPRTAASCVFVAIICICIIACMPEILNGINNLLKNA